MVFDTRKSTTNKIQTRFNSINRKFGVCACVKNDSFANFTQEKKTNVMYFLIICFILNVFHCFLFLHKCHSQLYLHPSAKECSKLLKQCLYVGLCVYLFSSSNNAWEGNATAKAHFGYWIFTQWGFSNAFWLSYSIQFVVSRFFSERFKLALIQMEHTFCFFLLLCYTRQKANLVF